MKPDFALSLSFEGISLLVRAAGGWRVAGEVGLDAPDLKAELARLRAIAVDRGGQGFRSKLIIPRGQIRYLTVETGHLSAADRHAEVRRALDGATPYAVDDLVYDICEDGALTHVAAVARETLDEAESFAAEHKFNPVSFVAVPGEESFLGEPFFGATRFSRKALTPGERVEPDGVAVVTIGQLEDLPKAPLASEADRLKAADAAMPLPVSGTDTGPKAAPDATGQTAPEPAPAAVSGFSTRRGSGTPPVLGGATRGPEAPVTTLPAPRITITEAIPAKAEAAPPVAPDVRPAAIPVPGPDRDSPKAADPAGRQPRIGDAGLGGTDTPAAEAPKTWAERFLARAAEKPAEAGGAPRPAPPPAARPDAAPSGLRMPRPKSPEAAANLNRAKSAMVAAARRPVPQPQPVANMDPEEAERRRMTIFGARSGDVAVGGKPRHLGLILTAVLLVFLAAVAAWVSIFMDDGVAGLFGQRQPEIVAVVPGPADPAPAPAEVAEAPEPPAAAVPETRLTDTDVAVLDALRVPEPDVEPLPEAEDLAAPVLLRTEAPLTNEDAQARYAVTGIWERAPDAPRVPGVVDLDSLYLTSIDQAVPTQDAVALVAPELRATDDLPEQVSLPIEPGLSVTLGADGRITPTPEGAVSPDGFTVFLGRPPVVPPAPPTRFEATPAEAEAVPQAPALPGIRPQTRPQGLVEGNERSQFGGLTRNELADLRPRVRPLIETPAAAEAVTTETAAADFLSATDQAVLASLAPRQRPSGFSQVVSAARTAPAPSRAEPEAEADGEKEPTRVAAVARAAPSIPSSASVARQATVKNAINLRKVNLIGVYGTPSNRRALVRLPNGRYQKVTVGDRLDGGRVSAIGDSELRYQKGGRNVVLSIPSG